MDILDFCRSNSAQISEDIKDEYFPNGDFEIKKDAFFDKLKESNVIIDFPFDTKFLFNKENYPKVVKVLPEFLASIFHLGFDKVSTFIHYNDRTEKSQILVSNRNLRQVSEVLLNSYMLLRNLIASGYTDQKLKHELLENLNLINFRKIHYDIIGCFQSVHTSFILMLDLEQGSLTRELDFFIPKDQKKHELLIQLVGKICTPQKILLKQRNLDSADVSHLRFKIITEFANTRTFPSLPLVKTSEGKETLTIDLGGKSSSESMSSEVEPTEKFQPLDKNERKMSAKLKMLRTPFITKNKVLLKSIVKLSPLFNSTISILIRGNTGTGKDVLANAIHELSGRKGKFIAMNCAGITSTLFESEIFGHVKGSFTGAVADKVGAFKLAEGGTLFLDEVGDLPLDQQAKLLRAVDKKVYTIVGTGIEKSADVRIIAATNIDLRQRIDDYLFREDLYGRLAGEEIFLPPLDDRPEDIPILGEMLFKKYAKIEGFELPKGYNAEIFDPLTKKSWPLNVRWLDNAMHKYAVYFKHGPKTKDALKSLINDEKIPLEIEKDYIFSNPEDLSIFQQYIDNGFSVNATCKNTQNSRDTVAKIINGVFIRLVTHYGDIDSSISFLIDLQLLHKGHTQAFVKIIEGMLKKLETKYLGNKSLKRLLYKDDIKLFHDFITIVKTEYTQPTSPE